MIVFLFYKLNTEFKNWQCKLEKVCEPKANDFNKR